MNYVRKSKSKVFRSNIFPISIDDVKLSGNKGKEFRRNT